VRVNFPNSRSKLSGFLKVNVRKVLTLGLYPRGWEVVTER